MFKGRNCLIFILLLVFLIGCSHENLGPNLFPGKRGDVVSRGFGLQVEFLNNQPPREIFLTPGFDSSVPLSVRVTNLGPDPVNGKIKVYNTLTSEYGGIPDVYESSFSVDGSELIENRVVPVDEIVPLGDLSYNFDALNKRIDKRVQDTLVTEIDMDYDVRVGVPICISDPVGSDDCRLSETITGQSLGRSATSVPVTVKSITKDLAPSVSDVLVSLKIVIVNVGNGKITNNDEKINDLIVSLDGDVLNCLSTNNKNSLKQGNFEVRCDVRRSPVFETPLLQISYNYGYKIKSSLPISIVLPED